METLSISNIVPLYFYLKPMIDIHSLYTVESFNFMVTTFCGLVMMDMFLDT